MIAALRHVLERHSSEPTAASTQCLLALRRYLYNSEPPDDLAKYKIRSAEGDFRCFRSLVDTGASDEHEHVLARCFRFFYDCFDKYLADHDDETRSVHVIAMLNSISQLLSIFTLSLEPEENEYLIFETLNARGEPLTEWDKAKNHILARHASAMKKPKWGDSESFYQEHLSEYDANPWWRERADQARFSGDRINLFLNHWLMISTSRTIPHQLSYWHFTNYAKKADSLDAIEFLVSSFRRFSSLFHAVETHGDDNTVQGLFRHRRGVLRAGVVVPTMMRLMDLLGPGDAFDQATRSIESFLVRRLVMGHYARGYEDLFLSLLQKLNRADAPAAVEIVLATLEQFHGRWPDDIAIQGAVPMDQVQMQPQRVKMILEAIERHLQSAFAGNRFTPNDLSLEHIMPQAWKDNWPLASNTESAIAQRTQAVQTLGNLTLTNKKLNSALNNDPWTKKRKTLSQHDNLFLNKELLQDVGDDDWNEEAIRRRGSRLADRICQIWPSSATLRVEFGLP